MKKNKFFFLLMLPAVMLVSVFISCSTDDPDPNAYDFNDEIATGTWKIDSVVGFYPMRYFVLNDKFNGGTLYLQKGGMYQWRQIMESDGILEIRQMVCDSHGQWWRTGHFAGDGPPQQGCCKLEETLRSLQDTPPAQQKRRWLDHHR